MITEKGKKYFPSSWTECDCHMSGPMYDAMIRLSGEFTQAIGVVHREYNTGMVRVATVYEDDIADETIESMVNRLEKILKEEYAKSGWGTANRNYRIEIYRYNELSQHGYSDDDIKYCFMWRNILRKELT